MLTKPPISLAVEPLICIFSYQFWTRVTTPNEALSHQDRWSFDMALCIINGNSQMYGLGIPLGFYLQWIGSILSSFLIPRRHRRQNEEDPLKDEIKGLKFSNNVFAAATFLALFIITVKGVSSLQPVEVHIILLLTFGYSLIFVPIYSWRLITRGNPLYDATRWAIVRPSPVESVLKFLLTAAVASFQLWFWFVRIPHLHNLSCEQYGFLLTKVRLDATVIQVISIVLYFAVLLLSLFILLRTIYDFRRPPTKQAVDSDKITYVSASNQSLEVCLYLIPEILASPFSRT